MSITKTDLRKLLKKKPRAEVRKDLNLSEYMFNKLLIQKGLQGERLRIPKGRIKFKALTDEKFAEMYLKFGSRIISFKYELSITTVASRAKRLNLRIRGKKNA